METIRSRRSFGIFGRAVTVSIHLAREDRALRRALGQMPKPVPWEWAAPRLIPVIAGPVFDPPGEPLVRVRSELGPMVDIGLDLGAALTFVDTKVAERWECSPHQLMERALQNLRDRASRLTVDHVQTGVLSGRAARILDGRPRWAASVLLTPADLFRLFGPHDQFVAAPSADCLLSLPLDTPTATVADIVVDFEMHSQRPLFLDPFLIRDGELEWAEDVGDDDGQEDWTS